MIVVKIVFHVAWNVSRKLDFFYLKKKKRKVELNKGQFSLLAKTNIRELVMAFHY